MRVIPAQNSKHKILGFWKTENFCQLFFMSRGCRVHFVLNHIGWFYLFCFGVHWLIKWRTESGEVFPSSSCFDWHPDFLTTSPVLLNKYTNQDADMEKNATRMTQNNLRFIDSMLWWYCHGCTNSLKIWHQVGERKQLFSFLSGVWLEL